MRCAGLNAPKLALQAAQASGMAAQRRWQMDMPAHHDVGTRLSQACTVYSQPRRRSCWSVLGASYAPAGEPPRRAALIGAGQFRNDLRGLDRSLFFQFLGGAE
jgi:hypothetical protein